MRIICTNRGGHPQTPCGYVYRDDVGILWIEYTHGELQPLPRSGPRCGRCGRDPRRDDEVWREIWTAAMDAGVQEFDISGLPF